MLTTHDRPDPALADWLVDQGLQGTPQVEILQGYCDRLVQAGVPLMRVHLAQSALHPRYGGIGFDWLRGGHVEGEHYAHRDTPLQAWRQSPFYHMLRSGLTRYRAALGAQDPMEFPVLHDLRAMGGTDYLAAAVALERVQPGLPLDPENAPEGMMVSWTAHASEGFSETDLALLEHSLPPLALALKSASNRQMAQDLLGVYLGADAGARVLLGEIERGSLQQIDAVILNFDLAGFTALAEQLPGPEVIALLNAYFAVVVPVIEAHGGNILKFMGDGVLAIFDVGEIDADARAALAATAALGVAMAGFNRDRAALGLAVCDYTLALHAGELLYGNIGAESRLDFTVIGPAVNQTARVAGMHKSLGQRVLLSQEVADAARPCAYDLVSLGRYMLRDVGAPIELFTLYQGSAAGAG